MRGQPTMKARVVPTAGVVSAVAASGVLVGMGTQVLQGILPEAWGVLANSGVMWALMAFALGTIIRSCPAAAVGGALQLVIASVSYYVAVVWFEGGEFSVRGTAIWSVAGICSGAVFGAAGHGVVRCAATRSAAFALVAGTLLVEGAYLTWYVGNPTLRPAGIVELLAGSLLGGCCLLGSSPRNGRWVPGAVLAATVVVTAAAGTAIQRAFLLT